MTARFNAKNAEKSGYTEADWDAVSDSPELTAEEIKTLRPAKEVLPPAFFDELAKARKARGRPPIDKPKLPVTIRLNSETINRFKATGKGWQSRMSDILDKAAR